MARPRKAPTTHARLAQFANEELQLIVNGLHSERDFKTSAPDVLGALVLAARGLPLELVEALIPAYVARERAEEASLGTAVSEELANEENPD
jgi:hypothetical protein